MDGNEARMEDGSAFKILTGNLTGKKPLGRLRHRWEENFKMDLKEIGVNARNWVDSVQDKDCWKALVNDALNLRFPLVILLLDIPNIFQNDQLNEGSPLTKFPQHMASLALLYTLLALQANWALSRSITCVLRNISQCKYNVRGCIIATLCLGAGLAPAWGRILHPSIRRYLHSEATSLQCVPDCLFLFKFMSN